jgi:ADP-ribose pyrophosphatase YjhB (NUDIX family)
MATTENQKSIVCVYMLFMQNEQVSMSRRVGRAYMNEHYQIPTGHVETITDGDKIIQEKPTTTVIRESLEEAGVIVKEEDVELILTQMKPSIDMPEVRSCLYFKINKWQGELANKEPDKADNFGFYPINNPPQPLAAEIASAFRAINEGRRYDEFGYR